MLWLLVEAAAAQHHRETSQVELPPTSSTSSSSSWAHKTSRILFYILHGYQHLMGPDNPLNPITRCCGRVRVHSHSSLPQLPLRLVRQDRRLRDRALDFRCGGCCFWWGMGGCTTVKTSGGYITYLWELWQQLYYYKCSSSSSSSSWALGARKTGERVI